MHRALFQRADERVAGQSLKQMAEHISDTETKFGGRGARQQGREIVRVSDGAIAVPPAAALSRAGDGSCEISAFLWMCPGLAMSGAVPLSTMTDDFYQLDSQRNQLVGRRTRRVIKIGDKVEVQVAKVDRFKKQVDFRLAGQGRGNGAGNGERTEKVRAADDYSGFLQAGKYASV